MKKAILVVALTLVFGVTASSMAGEGPYVSGNLGLAMLSDSDVTDSALPGITLGIESDSGLALGVAVGYDFGNNTRVEGEIAYQKNDLDTASVAGVDAILGITGIDGVKVDLMGDTSSLAFLLNGYYTFTNETAFTTFISAGLGFAKVELNDFNVVGSGVLSINYDDTVFAYQVGAGAGYAVNEKITLDVKYRYFGTLDPDFDTSTIEYSSHNIYVGIRFAL